MNPTAQQLKDKGWTETSDGVWHRGKEVRWEPFADVAPTEKPTPKRIRQSTKPLLNKLEQEWLDHLRASGGGVVRTQAITFRLANGLRYTPDMLSFGWPSNYEDGIAATAWEVKGGWFTDDANAKLKMFATTYPEIRVVLCWKDTFGMWQTQRVLP